MTDKKPVTILAKKLLAIREKAIKNGMTLLNRKEILEKIRNDNNSQ